MHVLASVVAWLPAEAGRARTTTAHVAPGLARGLVPQPSLVIVKFVESVRVGAEHPVAVAVPEFVSVNVFVAEFVPTSTSPKSNRSGLQANAGRTPVAVIWFMLVVAVPP